MTASARVATPSPLRIVLTLVAWVVGSLGLACVAAPAVHAALLAGVDGFTVPYSRVFNRVALVFGLMLLWFLRRGLDASLVAAAWRREGWRERGMQVATGFVPALGLALLALPLVVSGGEVRWSPEPLSVNAVRIARGVPGALLASGLEEAFFRVMLFGGLAVRSPAALAAIVSSAFYAGIHFLAPRHDFVWPGWSPTVGFEYFADVLHAFVRPGLLPALAGLFFIGLALCAVYRRNGSFALCVGLHAGWFMAAKAGVHLLQIVPGSAALDVGKRVVLLGSPWTWLAIMGGALAACLAPRRSGPARDGGTASGSLSR